MRSSWDAKPRRVEFDRVRHAPDEEINAAIDPVVATLSSRFGRLKAIERRRKTKRFRVERAVPNDRREGLRILRSGRGVRGLSPRIDDFWMLIA
jgi:hypothetical protein